jgi:hypothetical protein
VHIVTIERFEMISGFLGHPAISNSLQHAFRRVLPLRLHQYSSNSFHRQTFHSLRVPKLSPCFSHSSSRLTNYEHLHSHCRLNLSSPFKKAVSSQTEQNSCAKSKLYYDRRSVDLSILVSDTHLGLAIKFCPPFFNYFLDSYGFDHVGRPLWREVGSVVFSCCWASPAQSFSGLSPAGLKTVFYCPNFLDSPNLEGQVPVFISPQNQNYITTDGQLTCLSWCQTPIWDSRSNFLLLSLIIF